MFRLLFESLYAYKRNTMLPFSGGLMEQPNWWYETLELFDFGLERYLSENKKVADKLKGMKNGRR